MASTAEEAALPGGKFDAIGALLDAIQECCKRPLTYTALTLPVWLSYLLIRGYVMPPRGLAEALAGSPASGTAPAAFILDLLELAAEADAVHVLCTALAVCGSLSILSGRRMTRGEAVKHILPRLLPLAVLAVCFVLLSLTISAGLLAFAAGVRQFAQMDYVHAGLMAGGALLVIAAFFLWLVSSIAFPVCIAGKRGPAGSLSRSAALTRGHRWSILGGFSLLFFVSILLPFIRPVSPDPPIFDRMPPDAVALLLAAAILKAIFCVIEGVYFATLYRALSGSRQDSGWHAVF
jgi:hypothetical protein